MRVYPRLATLLLAATSISTAGLAASQSRPDNGARGPTTLDKLSPIDVESLMRAGNYARTAEGWSGCDGMATVSPTESTLDDLNGDGKPEAVIISNGIACYGGTEVGFQIMTTASDGWKSITDEPGVPTFLDTSGTDGFPDIEVGGPGFCFPVERWDGKRYNRIRFQYDGKPCTPN